MTRYLTALMMLACWLPAPGQSLSDTAIGHYYTSFDGTRIYYETAGRGHPVVLLHGFTNTGQVWKQIPLYHGLQQAGFELIIPDLRGNGRSDKPHDPAAYLNDAEARDVMGILDRMRVKQYSLVGYSRGSIIAARLLVLDPRVNRAVLGGMGTGFTDSAWARRKLFYRVLIGDTTVPQLNGMLRYVKQSGLDQRALALQQYGQPYTSQATLNRIQKPVMVICGDIDQDNGSGRDLAALFPKGVFVTVPGNHGAAMRSPEFSREVMAFLQKGK